MICRERQLQAFISSLFCLLVLAGGANAQPVALWGRWEQTFTAISTAAPETQFAVELNSPSGKVSTIAGFWDGGTTWRARFMPVEAGTWHYRTHSIPTIDGLDGKRGSFVCVKETGRNRFQRHGPIRVSANGRFFEHADGTPFFWMGDTVWYGAILSRESDWNIYLTDRASKRFNVVHFNVVAPRNGVASDENGEVSFEGAERLEIPPSRLSRLITKGSKLIGLGEEKPIRMNPRFYQRLDNRIDAVNSHGFLVAIVLTWALRPQDSGNALPEGEVIRMIRYLEARYGANHVVWIVTGDSSYEGADGERWKRIGRAVFDGRDHAPVSTHSNSLRWPWENFREEKWLDFVVYQSGHGDDAQALRWIHSGSPSRHWQNPPSRPFINLEPPYEGHLGRQSGKPHTDYTTRRAIYWSLLNAPTAGVTYGAHGVWSWHTAVGQPPTDHPDTGIAKVWHEALSLPGSTRMNYLEKFFTSIPWWTLQPDNNLLADESQRADPATHVSGARSENRDLAIFYLPVGGELELKKGVLRENLSAQWFNPRTGERVPIRRSRQRFFQAPDQQDWVLLLRRN
jgi:Protein of unknown function (DUF4038)/Domain of unknown function (DUF5060)/Putative collagen-binding domain of a collagenase